MNRNKNLAKKSFGGVKRILFDPMAFGSFSDKFGEFFPSYSALFPTFWGPFSIVISFRIKPFGSVSSILRGFGTWGLNIMDISERKKLRSLENENESRKLKKKKLTF